MHFLSEALRVEGRYQRVLKIFDEIWQLPLLSSLLLRKAFLTLLIMILFVTE